MNFPVIVNIAYTVTSVITLACLILYFRAKRLNRAYQLYRQAILWCAAANALAFLLSFIVR